MQSGVDTVGLADEVGGAWRDRLADDRDVVVSLTRDLPTVRGDEVQLRLALGELLDNATRFSNYFHVLRELVHLTNGWLPLEPSWPRKYALGDHVHDDARALTKIKRRLYELRSPSDYPGSPSPELEELLDRMAAADSAPAYLDVAYGEAKPQLAAIRLMLSSDRSSSSAARWARWRTSQRCGGVPIVALNALAK